MKGRKLWRQPRIEGTSLELFAPTSIGRWQQHAVLFTDAHNLTINTGFKLMRVWKLFSSHSVHFEGGSELFIGLGPRGLAIIFAWALQLLHACRLGPMWLRRVYAALATSCRGKHCLEDRCSLFPLFLNEGLTTMKLPERSSEVLAEHICPPLSHAEPFARLQCRMMCVRCVTAT